MTRQFHGTEAEWQVEVTIEPISEDNALSRDDLTKKLEQAEDKLARANIREQELTDDIYKLRAELRQETDNASKIKQNYRHIDQLIMNAKNFALYRLSVSADNGAHGRVIFTSPSFQEITGVSNPADQNTWFEVVHPDDIQYMLESQEQALKTGIFDVTYRTFHPVKNEWRWLHAYCSCNFEADGEVKFFNGFIEDITDKKRADIELNLIKKKTNEQMINYQIRLQKLTQKQFESEQQESLRIAEILHDNIGQELSLALFKMNQLKEEQREDNSKLNELSTLLEQAISYTRFLTKELCPPALCQMGLSSGIEWLTHRTQEHFDIKSELELEGDIDNFDDELGIVIFRIIAELLNNTAKHSEANNLVVRITRIDGQISLSVEDDGKGFDYSNEELFDNDGFGLFIISERLRSRGGKLNIKSDYGKGTIVEVILPIRIID